MFQTTLRDGILRGTYNLSLPQSLCVSVPKIIDVHHSSEMWSAAAELGTSSVTDLHRSCSLLCAFLPLLCSLLYI